MRVEQVMFRSGPVRCAGKRIGAWSHQHLRRAPRFVPSPSPDEAEARGLRPEYRRAS